MSPADAPGGMNSNSSGASPDDAPPSPANRDYAYRPALDGLRAIAVVPVLLYHASLEAASGGFLGVDLFFVISGYLITTLLLRETSRTGTIRLGAFWIRRARRLFPALFSVLSCVLLYGLVASDAERARMTGDVYSTLAYVANWWFAFSGESYFDQFVRPSMLRHTWSLAIEEQFYLVWPLIVWWGARGPSDRRRVWLAFAVLGAIASAVLMGVLYEPGADPSRVYYGTDTRAQTLLVGVALAFLLVRVPDHVSSRRNRISSWASWTGTVGLIVCLILFHQATDRAAWMYRGGYLSMALASACAVAGAVSGRRDSAFVRGLSWSPLVWIGARSYGLYLWHWPVYVLCDAKRLGIDEAGFSLLAIRLIVTTIVAVISYRYVETPIRKRAWTPRRERHALIVALAFMLVFTPIVTWVSPGRTDDDPASAGSTLPFDPSADTMRVLVVGDSVALTLATQRPPMLDSETNLDVRNSAHMGCGILRGDFVLDEAIVPDEGRCDDTIEKWGEVAEEFDPEVAVILLGGWEVYDRNLEGENLMLGTDAHREHLVDRLEQGIDILRGGGRADGEGRPVFLLTVPCYDNVIGKWPRLMRVRNEPHRWKILNEAYRVAESRFPDKFQLLDLQALVCPDGAYLPTLDGVALHTDGVHYTREGAHRIWAWLAPYLHAAVADPTSE